MSKKNQNPYDDEFDQDELNEMNIEDVENYVDGEYYDDLSDDEFEKYVEENMKNLSELGDDIYDDPSGIIDYSDNNKEDNNDDIDNDGFYYVDEDNYK